MHFCFAPSSRMQQVGAGRRDTLIAACKCDQLLVIPTTRSDCQISQVFIQKVIRGDLRMLFGNEHCKVGHFAGSVISTPSLLPTNLGETYEKRANCYLKSVKSEVVDGDHCDQTLMDIQHALEYNKASWNANYLAAQCYRRQNNLSEAIRYYETALALSPAQKQVKLDLDTCKVLAGVYSRKDNLNPRLMPMNLEERVANFNNETGMKISKEQFIKEQRDFAGTVIKGQDHVFRGHQYFYGWEVEQSFTEAVKYYTKADIVGNPEGSYNLALCYHYGRGVKGDVEKAFKIYKRVAEMDGNVVGERTPSGCNAGIASAQHSVGLCYDYGTGVAQEHKQAVVWYEKAMENGSGAAAYNLGLLYSEGLGVALDEKMAEMCWKQGVNLKDVSAAESLVGYYIQQLEPEMAEEWIKTGRELGSYKLRETSDEEFSRTLVDIKCQREDVKSKVTDFEKEHNLNSKGLTFKQRLDRTLKHTDPNTAKMQSVQKYTLEDENIFPKYDDNWGGKVQLITTDKLLALQEKATQGSLYAKRILQTIKTSNAINYLLTFDIYEGRTFKLTILNMLYQCVTLEFHFLCFDTFENLEKVKSIVAELFEETCEQKGPEDQKNRLCYIIVNLKVSLFKYDDTYALEIIKEGVRRYPKDQHYHIILLYCMAGRSRWAEGILYAKKALAKIPDNVDLLYHLASCLHSCDNDYEEVMSAYEKFLAIAPREHKHVPEAFYHISFLLFNQFKNRNPEDIIDMIRLYVKRGEEAEKDQLPCFLPYGESIISRYVKAFLGKIDDNLNTCRNGPRQSEKFIQPKSVLERKPYLRSPVRKKIILQHRQNLKKGGEPCQGTIPPKLTQTVAKKFSTLKTIILQEMNPTEDKIFDNRVLELTIIDEPNPHYVEIHLVAEDENGDTTRLYIYNVTRDAETMERFQAGCRIAIINPYLQIGAFNGSNGIRNDETKCILDLEKVKKMCRFCGERNSILICIKCKRPYCSPECANLDLELFDHKLICPKK